MPEFLLLINPHWTNELTTEEIDSDDINIGAYCMRKGPGFIAEVQNDGFFATPSNITGKGWNGSKFWLIKIPGTVDEYRAKITKKMIKVQLSTKQKDIEVVDDTIDIDSVLADATQEEWVCNFPGAKESAQVRLIYTFADKNKLKTKKEKYDKTKKVVLSK